MTPRKLSHYEIREELSRGGMGIVYRALDFKLEREVALKLLPPDLMKNEVRKRRFVEEIEEYFRLLERVGVVTLRSR